MNITFSENECIYNYFITTKRRIATVLEIKEYIEALSNYFSQNNIGFSISNNMEDNKLYMVYPLQRQIYYILDPTVNTKTLVEHSRINFSTKVINKLLAFDLLYSSKFEEDKKTLINYYKIIKRRLMLQQKEQLTNLINTTKKISAIDNILDDYDEEVKHDRK